MPKKPQKREYEAKRKFSLRSDSHVGSAQEEIARVFGLPRDSVRLVLPSGRRARADKLIARLLDDWERSE